MYARLSFAVAAFVLCAFTAHAQPNSLIVKLDTEGLPEHARHRLGRLSGFRYTGQFAGNGAVMSADAKLLAVNSMNNGTIDVLELSTGKLVQNIKAQAFGSVAGMAFSPDNKVLAIENFGQDMKLWDVATGKQVQALPHRNNGGGVRQGPSFSKDGKIVCIGSERFINNKGNQGEIKAWEVATAKIIGPFETLHNYNIRAVVAPDGKSMISWGHYSPRGAMGAADRDIPKTLQVWDLAKGKEARQIKIDLGPQGYGNIVDAAFAPDGKTLAITSGMSTFHIMDYDTGKELRRFSGIRGQNALRFSPDGAILASYDQYGGMVQAWDMKTERRIDLADGPKTQIMGVGFPGDGRIIALGNLSQSLMWWEATNEKPGAFQGHLAPITGLAYAPDGKTLITAGSDQRLFYWNSLTGQQERELRLIDDDIARYGYSGGNTSPIALSPDARLAATVSNAGNGAVRMWNLKTGKALFDFEGPRSYSQPGMAFSPDSTKLASSGNQYPLHIWNVNTGQELPKLPALPGQNFDGGNGPSRIAFSPNGAMVAVHLNHYDRFTGQPVSDLILWDMVKSREAFRLKLPMTGFNVGGSGNIAFSLDSHFLAVSDGAGSIILYNTLTGTEWRRLASTLRNSAFSLAFSSDGRFLAAGSIPRYLGGNIRNDDPLIEIWEVASGLKREQHKGHTAAITGLVFSPDGTTLASTSMDTTALLWDLTGKSGPKVTPITESDLPAAWNALVGKDPGLALTLRRMAFAPEPTVNFLKKHFLPIKGEKIDEKTMDALVANLDSSNFRIRETASKELIRLGERAEPSLKKGLERNLTVEARRRVSDILAAIVRHEYTPGELQAVRAVEVLERIGTAEARAWLDAHSKGDPVAVATREARKALKRMAVN